MPNHEHPRELSLGQVPMLDEILKNLENLSGAELIKVKEKVLALMEKRSLEDLGRRISKRAKVNIPGTCFIEREKEFFDKEHKILIKEMSVNGMLFETSTLIYTNDLLGITFRSPSTGINKFIDCLVVRVDEVHEKPELEFIVAVKAVDKKTVQSYKEMLSKRVP